MAGMRKKRGVVSVSIASSEFMQGAFSGFTISARWSMGTPNTTPVLKPLLDLKKFLALLLKMQSPGTIPSRFP